MPTVGYSRLLIANATIPSSGGVKFFTTPKFIRCATVALNNDAGGTQFSATEPVGGGTAIIAKGLSLNLQISGQMDTNQGSSFDISQYTFDGTSGDDLFMIYED